MQLIQCENPTDRKLATEQSEWTGTAIQVEHFDLLRDPLSCGKTELGLFFLPTHTFSQTLNTWSDGTERCSE